MSVPSTMLNRWLQKALREATSFEQFNKRVAGNVRWYGIPPTWTLKELKEFYEQQKEAI